MLGIQTAEINGHAALSVDTRRKVLQMANSYWKMDKHY